MISRLRREREPTHGAFCAQTKPPTDIGSWEPRQGASKDGSVQAQLGEPSQSPAKLQVFKEFWRLHCIAGGKARLDVRVTAATASWISSMINGSTGS